MSGQPSRCEKDHGGLLYKRKEKRPQRSMQPQKRLVIDNWGNSAGFHAARQDAQLPRLTVHWLSVTRATEGPLSEISGPYFDLACAAKDVGHVETSGGSVRGFRCSLRHRACRNKYREIPPFGVVRALLYAPQQGARTLDTLASIPEVIKFNRGSRP